MTKFSQTGTELYSQFIHLSRYSRWLENQGRRETWEETVDRYVSFFVSRNESLAKEISEIKDYILNFKVMPSMRCLMTAGKALEKDEVAGYNCSFCAIDHPRAFDEILYILMCGTGAGFSVERQYINKLPEIAEEFHESDTVIVVPDSKIGWASSFRELISLLYAGKVPKWDLSKLRPSGARLKTFGGRSSGPEPLDSLFRFTVNMFRRAAGRKLNSLECHDLVCKIADIVVVGGVRRSALISLSNLSDDRMRTAKSGQWWIEHPQRRLANNSACYTERPDFEIFMKEWFSLYESKSGERGIFSKVAAQKQASKTGRRDSEQVLGTNPCCVTGDTLIMTVDGPKKIKDLKNKPFKALVNGKSYNANKGSWVSGIGQVYKLSTHDGFEVNLTLEHKVLTDQGWLEAKHLISGQKIILHNHEEVKPWGGEGSWNEGYLLGLLLGDGNFTYPKRLSTAEIKTWKKDVGHEGILKTAKEASSCLSLRSDWKGWREREDYFVMSIGNDLTSKFEIDWGKKKISFPIEESSYDFHCGFLRGIFDADGHIEGSQAKGFSIRLGSTQYNCLQKIQIMLSHIGIKSVIRDLHENRKTILPDGKGGHKEYDCNQSWRLIISSASIKGFHKHIGFSHTEKSDKLDSVVSSIEFYKTKFFTKFKSLTYLGEEEVWDAEVDEVHAFDANGLYLHNSEILLRNAEFCNLSEVIVRSDDTLDSLKDKVKVATIVGTLQSTLTNFRYLRKIWKKNCEEERLLGVSLTGIMDHPVLSTDTDKTKEWLTELKLLAIEVNKKWADLLGINPSAAITCVKPSGTVSQLANTASGIHARFSDYYIRRVRIDKKDPIGQFMIDNKFPYETDKYNAENYIFSFPVKSPEDSVKVTDLDALKQLEIWKLYQDYWCEHKPSCTVYYNDNNFLKVGAWVWDNFEDISGVSFLPYSDHVYEQAPYEAISKEKFLELLGKMPTQIEWSNLSNYEKEDNTSGSQSYACTGAACEIVDLIEEK